MTESRRKYDDQRTHSLASYAHERIDRLEPKLDRLAVRVYLGMGGLAVIIFFAANDLLDLSKFNGSSMQAVASEAPK